MPTYSLGIDIGGTFTDIVVHDHDSGRQWSRKVLTTHDDPARAVAAGAGALLRAASIDPSRVTRVVHATTLFTNALIERKGARTALVTTEGFRDVLAMGTESRFEQYDLAFIWGVGPRVEFSGANAIPGFPYSAPFEDLKLKK